MKVLFLKTRVFLIIFFCAASVFAQSSEEWITGHKTDDIETFYRFEKSGSKTYEVEVKVINRRTKPVDVIVQFEQNDPKKISIASVDILSRNVGQSIKITVKAKETFVSEKVELEGLAPNGVKIVCWSNVDSKTKCDLKSFLPKKTRLRIKPR